MPSFMSRLRSLLSKKSTNNTTPRTSKHAPPRRPREEVVQFPSNVMQLAAHARKKIKRGKTPTPQEWAALQRTMGDGTTSPSTRRSVNTRKALLNKAAWSNANYEAAQAHTSNYKAGSLTPGWWGNFLTRVNRERETRARANAARKLLNKRTWSNANLQDAVAYENHVHKQKQVPTWWDQFTQRLNHERLQQVRPSIHVATNLLNKGTWTNTDLEAALDQAIYAHNTGMQVPNWWGRFINRVDRERLTRFNEAQTLARRRPPGSRGYGRAP